MDHRMIADADFRHRFSADCGQCFGLCCISLPYAQSADFAFDKAGGAPCRNLENDYRCGIHSALRGSGLKGCTVYDCFGAGQQVSRFTYQGKSWRDHPELAEEMFEVFPVQQQLHEMLCYLYEAQGLEASEPLGPALQKMIEDTERLIHLDPASILALDVPAHRARVSCILLRASEMARAKIPGASKPGHRGKDWIGANLRGARLRGASLRGVLLIAADLREADLRQTDVIGADFRDADLRGADLTGSIFLTQAQVNAARGDRCTKLPPSLRMPEHWI